MHARILGQARKRGLTYGVYSGTSRGPKDSSWDIEGQTNYGTAKELFKLIVQELRKVLNEEITEDELNAMKSYALGSFQMGGQTVASTAGFYASRYFWDGHIRDYKSQPKFIKQITREDIFRVAKEFYCNQQLGFLVRFLVVKNCKSRNLIKKFRNFSNKNFANQRSFYLLQFRKCGII